MMTATAAHPELQVARVEFLAARRAPAVSAVRRAIDRGELRSGVDPERVVDLLAGPVFYRVFVKGEPVDDSWIDAHAASVVRAFGPEGSYAAISATDPSGGGSERRVTSAPVILSDRTIREELAAGRIVIDPLDESCIQPSSVDLHIDRYFRVFRNHTMGHIDVKQNLEDLTELVEIGDEDTFMLHPGEFVLGSTSERVALPDDLVARLEGKSSLGRLGLLIHSTAGFVDAGWDGQLTLELSNVATLPITLYPGMKIGQISFIRMTTAADHPYGSTEVGSKYQGQVGPRPSRYWENFR